MKRRKQDELRRLLGNYRMMMMILRIMIPRVMRISTSVRRKLNQHPIEIELPIIILSFILVSYSFLRVHVLHSYIQ